MDYREVKDNLIKDDRLRKTFLKMRHRKMRDDSSSWDHDKGVGKQIFLVTGCSTFQPSPMVVSGEGCVHPSS